MYRSCIFCSAGLGSNDAVEHFPVGRSLAFDGAAGRLWAVCPACGRWNLAPIEERWEAIEEAERLFRDTRLRVQRENVGLARLPDGMRLVRVGQALPGELAAWRYGRQLARRQSRNLVAVAATTVATLGFSAAAVVGAALYAAAGVAAVYAAYSAVALPAARAHARRVVFQSADHRVAVRSHHLLTAHLEMGDAGVELSLPALRGPRGWGVVLRGQEARVALGRAMAAANPQGAGPGVVHQALGAIQRAGGTEEMLALAARRRLLLNGGRLLVDPLQDASWLDRRMYRSDLNALRHPVNAVAVEMALHEETERRALHGELAALEAMWRQAEEIAAIADALPDVPAPEPPRLVNG